MTTQPKSMAALSVNPETLRIFAFSSLLFTLLVSAILTIIYAPNKILNNPVVELFQTVNICVFFDSPPATYVAPVLWSICLIFFLCYFGLSALQAQKLYSEGKLHTSTYYSRLICLSITAPLFILFTLCFAISPYENVAIHAIAFLGFALAISIISLNNTLYYRKIIIKNKFVYWYVIVYNGVLLLILAAYLLKMSNTLLGHPWQWVRAAEHGGISPDGAILDKIWTSMVAVLPLVHAFYLRKKTASINIWLALDSKH